MNLINWSKVSAKTVTIVKSFVDLGIIPTVRTVYYDVLEEQKKGRERAWKLAKTLLRRILEKENE